MGFFTFCNTWIFAPVLPVLLLGAGIYLAVLMRGYPLRAPKTVLRVFKRKSEGGVSPFRAVTLALAGTLGVGNIAGVASAIAAGGPGAVFWMWISALCAMMVKYAEILLAVRYRKAENGVWHGGAMYYMTGRILPAVFAAICVAASFPLGNVIQIKAAAESLESVSGLSGLSVGLICAVLVLIVVGGGVHKISDLTVRLIPALSGLYIAMSAFILIRFASHLPGAFGAILEGAFSFRAAAGGGLGYIILSFLRSGSLRYGVTRGIMSNEAGCGTAPMAHAAAKTDSPAQQGCWGVFEVFCDTILLCTLTALVILVTGVPVSDAGSGMDLAVAAFAAGLGPVAGYLLCGSAFLFAFATVICWAYYGLECLHFLTCKPVFRIAYIILYALSSVYGSVAAPGAAWIFADFAVGVMTVLNTVCVCLHGGELQTETFRLFGAGTPREKVSADSVVSVRTACPKRN